MQVLPSDMFNASFPQRSRTLGGAIVWMLALSPGLSGLSGLTGLSPIMGSADDGPIGDALLKEDGDYLLLETGDYLLLE